MDVKNVYIYLKGKKPLTGAGEAVEKLEPPCTVGGDVKWCSRCEK